MPLKLILKFTKPNAETPSYVNHEIREKVREFQTTSKILEEPKIEFSEDGLVETRTIIYDSEESARDFRRNEAAIENQRLRDEWCKANNVKFSFTVEEI